MSRVFAYCRVSTLEQTTENQRKEIEAAGFNIQKRRIIEESISGSVAASDREGFSKLKERIEEGDVLVVTKLDRLGRNAMDIRKTVDELSAMDVRVHCLALGGVDLTSSAGKMTMQVISAVAEFEKDLVSCLTKSSWGISVLFLDLTHTLMGCCQRCSATLDNCLENLFSICWREKVVGAQRIGEPSSSVDIQVFLNQALTLLSGFISFRSSSKNDFSSFSNLISKAFVFKYLS